MEVSFRIEVKKHDEDSWALYEELKRGDESVRNYLRLIRTAFPNYRVRALDAVTGDDIETSHPHSV